MNQGTQRRLELLQIKARKIRIKSQRGGLSSEINVTPLVDVVLVLLIIFMLVLPKIAIEVDLPKELKPEKAQDVRDAVSLIFKKDKTLYVNDKQIDPKSLESSLEAELKHNPLKKVQLSADAAVEFREIRTLLSALRNAGVTQADLMGKRIEEEEQ